MKKLVLFFAICTGITFASCGNQTNGVANSTDTTDTDSVAPAHIDSLDSVSSSDTVNTSFTCGE